jgi:hypothetical protein
VNSQQATSSLLGNANERDEIAMRGEDEWRMNYQGAVRDMRDRPLKGKVSAVSIFERAEYRIAFGSSHP